MKVFIIFLALFIMNISFLVYHNDMNHYQRIQEQLKSTAAECAHGSAMLFDKSEFGKGLYVYNDSECLFHMEYMVKKLKTLDSSKLSELCGTVYFFDDSLRCRVYQDGKMTDKFSFSYPYSFTDKMGYSIVVDSPCIAVMLEGFFKDAFVLPYLSDHMIVRSAMYENKS